MPHRMSIEEINKAIGAHGAWKLKLKTAITHSTSDATPENMKLDDHCEFGKWLYGPLVDGDIKSGMPYKVVRRLHAEFHKSAGAVLELAVNGQSDKAEMLFDGEFSERSHILIVALNKWKNELMRAAAA